MPSSAEPDFEMEVSRNQFKTCFSILNNLREQDKPVKICFLFLSYFPVLQCKCVYLTADLCLNGNKQIPALSGCMCWF